jgi:CRISP-associated protein Cas1
MSSRWRVIDLQNYSGEVHVASGRVLAGSQEFPLSDVICILTGPDTRWSSAMVALAAKFDVPILTCDWRSVPVACTLPWSANSRVAARHHAQARLTKPRMKNAWMRIVQAKIKGQAANLPEGAARERLIQLAKQVRSGDPENREAQAARTYWSRFFAPAPFSRNRDAEGANAFLNYGYTIVRGAVIRAICVAGLSPTLSVQHSNRSNCFALADDLIEPFRPAVDHLVKSLPPDTSLEERETKQALVAVLSLTHGRSGFTVQTAINDLAQNFAKYVEGDSETLRVSAWQPSRG